MDIEANLSKFLGDRKPDRRYVIRLLLQLLSVFPLG